jgi:hypothetical protein
MLQKLDGGKKIPIDSIAMLSEHHVSDNYDGYATHYHSIYTDSFGTRDLAVTGLKAFPTRLIASSASKILLVRSPGLQNYPCWTKLSDHGNAQTWHS